MQTAVTDVAVVGAGPYGLSIASHLRRRGVGFRIFGTPMHTWRNSMPAGMCLKSEGFASNLSDPEDMFTLNSYSSERGLPYQDVGYPVPLETFIQYGLEFQRRLVPTVEETDIVVLSQRRDGFTLLTGAGESLQAKRVILAVGIAHFAYVPPMLAALGPEWVTHSSQHCDMGALRHRRVAIVGAGASAADLAGLMHEAGTDVQLVARRGEMEFHEPSVEPRPWLQRLRQPRSGLGLGWKSRLCTNAPLLFHAMPLRLRLRAVRRHLGPAPGWSIKDKVVGRVPMHLGAELRAVVVRDGQVHLKYRRRNGGDSTLIVDHVIAATGYRVSMQRLKFLDASVRQRLRCVEDSPVLTKNFEASVPGLYVVGLASADCFGPLTRFAYGAAFTARRLSRLLS
jgi:cation diffusion facilitator CzcD-associated flavoprotein CzcO